MEVAVLYSGGKDSSLAALILDKLGYDVQLVNANFGILDSWRFAEEAARALGFEFKVIKVDRRIAEEAKEIIVRDGFPNNGLNYVHKKVVEEVAKHYKAIADGTRRDDRVPWLEVSDIRRIEDKYGVEYIAPLRGIGYKTLRSLAERYFKFEIGDSKLKGDYECELRALIRRDGKKEEDFFPAHIQSKVIRRI
jgi:hypothetical protein